MSKVFFEEINSMCSDRMEACNSAEESLHEALNIYKALLMNTATARLCIKNIFTNINASDDIIADIKREMDSLAVEILDIEKDN